MATPTERRTALATRRAAAIELLRSDMSLAEIARIVGVSREAVRLWRKKLKSDGAEGLVATGSGQGRPSRLSARDKQRLVGRLRHSAKKSGFARDEWTTLRVRALLELQFGLIYTVPGLWRMLEQLGFDFSRERDCWRERLTAR